MTAHDDYIYFPKLNFNYFPDEVPMQKNNKDCGVFVCKYADFYAKGQSFNFTQNNMTNFRHQMRQELNYHRLIFEHKPRSRKPKKTIVFDDYVDDDDDDDDMGFGLLSDEEAPIDRASINDGHTDMENLDDRENLPNLQDQEGAKNENQEEKKTEILVDDNDIIQDDINDDIITISDSQSLLEQQQIEEEKLHLEEQQLLAKVQEIAKKRAKLQQQRVVQQGQSQQLPKGEPKHPVEVEKTKYYNKSCLRS